MLTQLNKHPTFRQIKLKKANVNLPAFYARSGPSNLGSKTPSINPSPIPPLSIHHQSIFCHFIAKSGCNKWCYLTELSCGLCTPISGVGHPSPVWWGVGALSPWCLAKARFSPGAHGWAWLSGRVFRERIRGPPSLSAWLPWCLPAVLISYFSVSCMFSLQHSTSHHTTLI